MTIESRTEFGDRGEETLRLLAELPPPAGLGDRVHRRLDAQVGEESTVRRGFWSLWRPAHRLQYAGAAVLVVAMAGATWSFRHSKEVPQAVQPAPQAHPFGSAAAEGHPHGLTPIKVPPAPKKKPSPSRAAKRTPKAVTDAAAQGAAAGQDGAKGTTAP